MGVPLVMDNQGRFAPYSSVSYAVNVAVVEVDIHTGRVTILDYVSTDDSQLINPMEAKGQYYGAFAHGIGGALYEELVYDERAQPLAQNFKDYLIPTALEVPPVKLRHLETPNPFTPGGFKGASETGAVARAPRARQRSPRRASAIGRAHHSDPAVAGGRLGAIQPPGQRLLPQCEGSMRCPRPPTPACVGSTRMRRSYQIA